MQVRPLHDRAVVRLPYRSRRMARSAAETVVTLTRAPDGAAIAAHCTGAASDTPPFSRPRHPAGRRAASTFKARGRPSAR